MEGAVDLAPQHGLPISQENEREPSIDDDRRHTVANSPPPESQPMTATTSTASDQAAQEGGEGGAAGSYGTRSRNRTGARPNYADDKDIDLEIEAAGRYSKAGSKKSQQLLKAIAQYADDDDDDSQAAPVLSGFAAINANAASSNGVAISLHASNHEALEVAAQSPGPVVSRKRKQPGSNATGLGHTTSSIQARPRAHGDTSKRFAETNMLSFARSGAHLNTKGQLVADDGTALFPNGEAQPS